MVTLCNPRHQGVAQSTTHQGATSSFIYFIVRVYTVRPATRNDDSVPTDTAWPVADIVDSSAGAA